MYIFNKVYCANQLQCFSYLCKSCIHLYELKHTSINFVNGTISGFYLYKMCVALSWFIFICSTY